MLIEKQIKLVMEENWGKFTCALAVVFFSLWFRLEYQANTIVDDPLRADAAQYINIGWNILHHGVVSMDHPNKKIPASDSYRSPGYPLLVALAILLGGEQKGYDYILIIQAILGALSVALTIVIARQWLSFPYAITAGVLTAVWPHLVSLSGFVLTETLFGFTLLLSVALLLLATMRQRLYQYALAGLSFAYTALVNPAILLLPLLVAVVLMLFRRNYAVIFLCCSLSLPAAWSVRSAMLESGKSSSGRLVENILAGSEPDFNYDSSQKAVEARTRVRASLHQVGSNPMAALGEITSRFVGDPATYSRWYFLQKPMRLWQWTILGDMDIYVYPVLKSPFHTQSFYRAVISICSSINTLLMGVAFSFVFIFAVGGIRHGFQIQELSLIIVTLVFVYATFLHTILTPDPRYAVPYRPFEILIALTLLSSIHKYLRDNRHKNSHLGELNSPKQT